MQSLGLYIHVPFCKHLCPYCDFYKIALKDLPSRHRLDFGARVVREHTQRIQEIPDLAHRPLASIYFGGGTPSTLLPERVREVISRFRALHPESIPEVTLEANPENLTENRCKQWRDAGVTRLSIGVQSFQSAELDLLERLHQPSLVADVVSRAREAGFGNVSLDLMFALPGQSIEQWFENLDHSLELDPEHISFYGLTYHEKTPFFERLVEGSLKERGEDIQAEMYLEGAKRLLAEGYEHYEISNFAKPGSRSIHNQRYWSEDDVLGLGPGAHSNVSSHRWANKEDLTAWEQACDSEVLPPHEKLTLKQNEQSEEHLFRLMRRKEGFRASASEPSKLFFEWLESDQGKRAVQEGLVVTRGDSAALTPEGWLVSDAMLRSILNES